MTIQDILHIAENAIDKSLTAVVIKGWFRSIHGIQNGQKLKTEEVFQEDRKKNNLKNHSRSSQQTNKMVVNLHIPSQ